MILSYIRILKLFYYNLLLNFILPLHSCIAFWPDRGSGPPPPPGKSQVTIEFLKNTGTDTSGEEIGHLD